MNTDMNKQINKCNSTDILNTVTALFCWVFFFFKGNPKTSTHDSEQSKAAILNLISLRDFLSQSMALC